MTTDNSDMEIIDEAFTHLVPSSKEEIQNDMDEAKNKLGKKINKDIKKIINKYEKIKLDKEELRIQYDKDICSKLIKLKNDFIPLFRIYNILTNENITYILKNHFILKKDGENDEDNSIDSKVPVIIINLCLLYDNNKYYLNLVKGILELMDSSLEQSYINQNIPHKFLDPKTGKSHYEKNIQIFVEALERIIKDINRVLEEHESNKIRFQDKLIQADNKDELNKMSEDKFKFILKKANLKYDDTFINIYKSSNNDGEIISRIKSLSKEDKEKYFELEGYIEEYLDMNSIKIENKELNNKINIITKTMNEQKTIISTQEEKIKSLEENIKSLEGKNVSQENIIKSLKEKNDSQQELIDQMNTKIEFTEGVVKALLTRKVINHCMNKFIEKYKDQITILYKKDDNDSFYIKVIKDINDVSVKESQELIDSLFETKDNCNDLVHFKGIKKPSFIDDIWDVVINFIDFDGKKKENFDKLFTQEIRKDFKFDQEDKKIKNKI